MHEVVGLLLLCVFLSVAASLLVFWMRLTTWLWEAIRVKIVGNGAITMGCGAGRWEGGGGGRGTEVNGGMRMVSFRGSKDNNNNCNERISRVPFYVKHAQLH